MTSNYIVTLYYREPTYEARRGHRAEPYRGTFLVEARNVTRAIREAERRFEGWQRLSGVSWVREIVGATCRKADAPLPGDDVVRVHSIHEGDAPS